jgi:putative transposase
MVQKLQGVVTFSPNLGPFEMSEIWQNQTRGRGEFAMKRSKFSEQQIAFALRQAETGTKVKEIIRKLGITEQTFYRWKKQYGGLAPSELKKMKQLEEENRRLKQMVADLSLDKAMLQDVIEKKL